MNRFFNMLMVGFFLGSFPLWASCECSGTILHCLCPLERVCSSDEHCIGAEKCVSGCCGGCVACLQDKDCKSSEECCKYHSCTTECSCNQCSPGQHEECEGPCMACDEFGCCVSIACTDDRQCPDLDGHPRFCGFDERKGCKICQYVRCDLFEGACEDPNFPLYVKCADNMLPACAENGLCECRQPCGSSCPEGTFCCKKDSDPNKWTCNPYPTACFDEPDCPACTKRNENPGGQVSEQTCKIESADCSCVPLDPLPGAFAGLHLSMALASNGNPVFAGYYGHPYGDLIFGQASGNTATATIEWSFVDGVPKDAPCVGSATGPRSGIAEPGDDVGWDTDIAVDANGRPRISYYDRTNGDLKYAYYNGSKWEVFTLDNRGDCGRFTSMALDSTGKPWIAFMALKFNVDGTDLSTIRVAQGYDPTPVNGNWRGKYIPVESVRLPAEPGPAGDWPPGVGLFAQIDMYSDNSPALVYYDSINKRLRFSYWNATSQTFATPVTLAVKNANGEVMKNFGANLSMSIERKGSTYAQDIVHIAGQEVDQGDIYYIKFVGHSHNSRTEELVDAGGRTSAGLYTNNPDLAAGPFHYVGNFASLVVDSSGNVRLAYQDGTSLDLVYATRTPSGTWSRTITKRKKSETEFDGAFGFFTNQVLTSDRSGSILGNFIHNLRTDPWSSRVEIIKK